MALSNTKRMAYSQVLEIIKGLNKEEYCRIPPQKISYFEENQLEGYQFSIDEQKPLTEQILEDTKLILANLFLKYVATKKDKMLLYELAKNSHREECEKEPTSLVLKRIFEDKVTKTITPETKAMLSKESWLQRLIQKMKRWIKKG